MIRRWAGAVMAALVFAAATPRAAQAERPKILVLPVVGKGDLTFRQRVTQALGEGLLASGGEVVAPGTGAGASPSTEVCTTAACLSAAARASGATYLLRATVEEEGRSYTFKLEMLDGQSGAVLAQKENRCEICTDTEALETANTAASALKTQAFKRAPAVEGVGGGGPPPPPAPAPRANGPRARVVVFDRLELPASLSEFHAKLRTALEGLIRDQGLDIVNAPTLPANCAWTGCAEDLIRGTRATHVLFVEGSRNDYGFSLDLTLRAVTGEDSEKAQGWCNFCTGPQMVTAAENVARPLVAHLAARPEPRAGGAGAVPGAGAGAEGRGGSSTGRLIAGIGLMVVGAASVAGGAYFWNRAGELTDCMPAPIPSDPPICISTQDGKGLGLGLMIGGGVAVLAGGWLAIFRNTSVAVSTNSVSVSGRF